MRITILCSAEEHPVNEYLQCWIRKYQSSHEIDLIRRVKDAKGGDLLFLISCSEIVSAQDRSAYRKSLLIHASALPLGRGWSPHVWQILEGETDITVTLLEAEDRVDTGDIWSQVNCFIPPHALWNEINNTIFEAELSLMDYAVEHFNEVVPRKQADAVVPTYYPRRTPADSEIDPYKSIAEQFDAIRVADPERFCAFFKLHGHVFQLKLEKMKE